MSNTNQINDLRDMLFAQMKKLADPSCNLDKEIMRSEALANVSNQIINSVKVEVDVMRVTGMISQTGIVPMGEKLLTDGNRRVK